MALNDSNVYVWKLWMETLKMIIYMLISRKWKGISTWPYKPIITRIFFGAHISSGCYLTHHFVKENCRSFISRSKTFSKNDAPFWDHNSIAFCPQRSCVSINGGKKPCKWNCPKKKKVNRQVFHYNNNNYYYYSMHCTNIIS